jgi:hypothetical protein
MILFREKSYSSITKYDLVDILVPRAIGSVANSILSRSISSGIEGFIVNSTADVMTLFFKNKINEFKNKNIGSLTNKYLIESLNKYGYKEGRDYTINKKNPKVTMNLNNGILMICMESGYNDRLVEYFKNFNSQITNIGKFMFISYQASGRNNLDKVINGLMKCAKNIDIYDNR